MRRPGQALAAQPVNQSCPSARCFSPANVRPRWGGDVGRGHSFPFFVLSYSCQATSASLRPDQAIVVEQYLFPMLITVPALIA